MKAIGRHIIYSLKQVATCAEVEGVRAESNRVRIVQEIRSRDRTYTYLCIEKDQLLRGLTITDSF